VIEIRAQFFDGCHVSDPNLTEFSKETAMVCCKNSVSSKVQVEELTPFMGVGANKMTSQDGEKPKGMMMLPLLNHWNHLLIIPYIDFQSDELSGSLRFLEKVRCVSWWMVSHPMSVKCNGLDRVKNGQRPNGSSLAKIFGDKVR
jgi:hypothetical protein